ncbi:MAG: hypothetical protein ACI9OJ_003863, partial [Myxococcota bacterium]
MPGETPNARAVALRSRPNERYAMSTSSSVTSFSERKRGLSDGVALSLDDGISKADCQWSSLEARLRKANCVVTSRAEDTRVGLAPKFERCIWSGLRS